ncbi:2OG-Fe(II) oxygenase family protein [Cysteiniphilum sp. QT6929]|uniref:2OG-Fe(II) oxygenase family protein n=1 Tax=Cysteiniphilum sp. QT6929 TaxID=2975055 RepID=UPI0024B3B5E5|nr:2OG-Fe(II) oxygenase family protein [Cysteiniphilum sp. QT6929]WHN66208.1 isopenicillin N synthase family oxygenase [Cysteiniphilum sp. QT6929]
MEILSVDYYADNAPKRFTDSLKQTGFGVLEIHPIDWQLIEDVYSEWREFINSKAAHNYYYDKRTQDGYFPMDISETAKGETARDIKHYFHLYFPNGRYPKEVSNKARELFDKLFKLGKTLLQWIDDHMDPETSKKLHMPLVEALSFDRTLFRVLHYPAIKGDEEPGAIRAAAHEDINLITLLPVASSPGLEVYSHKEDKWYEVPCKPQSIIINIGDMLQEMTNFEYIATKHRVVKPEGEAQGVDRMSTPCFMHAKADVYLSEKYKTADIFLDERLIELGVK